MTRYRDTASIFHFFFVGGLRSKRTKLFFIFSLIPALIFIIFRIILLTNPGSRIHLSNLYNEIALSFFFQLFIQIIALFFGSSVLNDEVDNKTLVYLTTSPVSKSSILFGKFLSSNLLAILIIWSGILISFLIAKFSTILSPRILSDLILLLAISLLAITAYTALFTFIGSFVRKTVLIGIAFIFGWESIVQFFPGATQKLTIIHYIKSLLPASLPRKGGFLIFHLEPSSILESLVVLLLLSLVAMIAASRIFSRKEYILSDGA